ncbi:MAG: acetolactate synthase small subunit [Kofleriaceae bacterium]|nr:acetolactate synthase small subunit [Kofleriaceae bacterium]MCB9573584.1 acetolactate synthase small subunit [Kofleriaceae bacterium]
MSPLLAAAAPRPRTPRTLVAHVEDRPGVLARVVTLFRRRGYNIVSLTVARTHLAGISRLTVVVDADDDTARRLEANLYKLIDVVAVDDVTASPAVIHELALVKVRASPRERTDVIELGKVFGARVVDVGHQTLTVELTATRDAVDRLIAALEPHGIVDLVRTGAVAMARGDAPPASADPNPYAHHQPQPDGVDDPDGAADDLD